MRVLVLNGVNLDVLGRRDPELYGGLTIAELESRIYEWARAARADRPVPPDERRGRVRQVVPRRVRQRRRDRRQPRRLDALRVGDPRRARDAHDPDRRGAPLERRRARGVAAALGRRRPRRRALRRPGPGRLREALEFLKEQRVSDRIERLRELARGAAARHEPRQRPLPDRLRELERRAARRAGPRRASSPTSATSRRRGRIEGVETVQTKRSLIGWLAETLGPRRLRGARPPVVVRRAAAGGRHRARAAAGRSSSSCARSRTRASSRRSGARARSPTGCSSGS